MRIRILSSLILAAGLTLAAVAPVPSWAAPRITVSSPAGAGQAWADKPTTLQLSGSGFQSLQGGFGGVYLMFGWVSDPNGGGWRPSNGGKVGAEMLYVPDNESKDNAGYQRFITFPGSSTGESANGGQIGADGSLQLSLVVPGPVFTAKDRSGSSRDVDCRETICGIITVGAHGVVNANNETFTPIRFVGENAPASTPEAAAETKAPPQKAVAAKPGANAAAAKPDAETKPAAGADEDSPAEEESPAPEVPATVGLSQSTVQAGRVVGFTGQGFEPGEQVVATLGAGLAAVGPLTAGRFGEVAGTMPLPAETRAGTHELTLHAAGSGRTAEISFQVMADPASVAAATPVAEPVSEAWRWAGIAVAGAAAVVLLLIISSLVSAIVRRRQRRAAAATEKKKDVK